MSIAAPAPPAAGPAGFDRVAAARSSADFSIETRADLRSRAVRCNPVIGRFEDRFRALTARSGPATTPDRGAVFPTISRVS